MNNINRDIILANYTIDEFEEDAGDEIRANLEKADREHAEIIRVITKELGLSY